MATIIDGKQTSADIRIEIKEKVEQIKSQGGKIPHLAAILVGNDGASRANQ
jgi:methylenetetrahydrofolate dehydrogenase (NADP+)/methenyltetrahydrofolate cyclohydrolase